MDLAWFWSFGLSVGYVRKISKVQVSMLKRKEDVCFLVMIR